MNLIARMGGLGGGAVNDKMARFGEARIQDIPADGKKVTFKDVAGADEEKEELEEIVEFLRDPQQLYRAWARTFPRACCWWALRAPARRCWPRPWPARPDAAVPLHFRLRFCGDVCGRGRQPRP